MYKKKKTQQRATNHFSEYTTLELFMFKNWGHAYEMGLTEIKLFNNRYREL